MQNGEQPLVTPVSPGAHAELAAGVTIVATAIDPADNTAADTTVNNPRVIGCLLMPVTSPNLPAQCKARVVCPPPVRSASVTWLCRP